MYNKNFSERKEVPTPQPVQYKLLENGIVSERLFCETAEKIAQSFAQNDNGQLKGKVSATQIRRLFDEVKHYQNLLTGPEKWQEQFPYIRMMKAKVSYTIARAIKSNTKAKEYYKNLEHFVFNGIDQIKEERDYHIFVALFEAVYGFYYGMNPVK